MQFFIFCHN